MLVSSIVFALMLAAPQAAAPSKEIPVHHAHGSFTVDIHPLAPTPAEGIGRFTINKTIHGDLEATTAGEMFTGGDPKQGAAGYVAIEVVTGTLGGSAALLAIVALIAGYLPARRASRLNPMTALRE